MFGKKDDIKALIRKTERASKKKKLDLEKAPLTPEEQTKKILAIILGVSGAITLVFAVVNIFNISKYDPSISSTIDNSRLDSIKNFISTESTESYEEVIARHNDENKNSKLDIKTVYSSTGREYPFANILNKTQDNISTKLCKFIYTELKPAIISYQMANGTLPLKESEDTNTSELDLTLLEDLVNIRDKGLEGYTYIVSGGSTSSTLKITVKDGDKVVPIILFDPTLFAVKEINKDEVNLVQGKHSLILKPMEEYNNIRLQSININGTSKSCTIVDTITNKVVKITVS